MLKDTYRHSYVRGGDGPDRYHYKFFYEYSMSACLMRYTPKTIFPDFTTFGHCNNYMQHLTEDFTLGIIL